MPTAKLAVQSPAATASTDGTPECRPEAARLIAPRAAYTLIEQIMVMLIIGLILAMVIGLSRYVNQRSNRALARSDLELWHNAVSAFANRYGRVPDPEEGDLDHARFQVLLPPGFSVEDPWGNPYHYERLTDHAFRVYSAGPDGQPGTEDDIHAD